MRNRSGFALVAALISVVLLGALIVGAFVATTEDARISGSVVGGEHTLEAAESSVQTAISGWAPGQADSLAVGQRSSRSLIFGGIPVTTTVIRLDSTLFLVAGEAGSGGVLPSSGSLIRRRVAVLVRRVTDSLGTTSLWRLNERSWSELF